MKTTPYVLVQNQKSGRAYILNRNYGLIVEDATTFQICNMKDDNIQSWDGWTPTDPKQRPDWVNDFNLPSVDFTAYWVKG